MKKALFYYNRGDSILCELCPNSCYIQEGKVGVCNQRRNRGGVLIAEGYGRVSAIALDPIEKKPLYHFYPGTQILSIGGLWCNLSCAFCQNWHISHEEKETFYLSPYQLVRAMEEQGGIGIAFTYNEPLIGYEYILDTAKLAREKGFKIVLVTNGFIKEEPLKELLPWVDAMNIDVKGFHEDYYRKICGGSLEPIKQAVEIAAHHCHLELTTLVVGGLNDKHMELEGLFQWVGKINKDIPLHLSRYFPNYRMQHPATSEETIIALAKLAKEFLNYVYIGNISGVDGNTYCPSCGLEIIRRQHHRVSITNLQDFKCSRCFYPIPIISDKAILL